MSAADCVNAPTADFTTSARTLHSFFNAGVDAPVTEPRATGDDHDHPPDLDPRRGRQAVAVTIVVLVLALAELEPHDARRSQMHGMDISR
jgi:hypothetical protein